MTNFQRHHRSGLKSTSEKKKPVSRKYSDQPAQTRNVGERPPQLVAPARVLMLGWEYPPRMAGGLGKACAGLSQAMARRGSQIYFVLPTFPNSPHAAVESADHKLHVMGARELMAEVGLPETDRLFEHVREHEYSEADEPQTASQHHPAHVDVVGRIVHLRARARLFPYGAAPKGHMTRRIRGLIERTGERLRLSPHAHEERESVHTRMGRLRQMIREPHLLQAGAAAAQTKETGEIYGKNLWSEIDRYCSAIRQISHAYEADVVHAHDWMSFPAALEYQKAHPDVPVFLHVHATEYDRSGENVNTDVYRIEREGFRRATHIFAVSQYTAGIIERLYGVPRDKITVAYNAPDDQVKHLIASPETARHPQVVFLGRLTFQKGPDHFLQAAKLVLQSAPKRLGKLEFLLCGTGDMMDQLVALARDLGIEGNVRFTGFIEPKDVDRILLNSRVLVMPSVSEPFGLVALEAIHCGIPVILSKQSGVREVLRQALQVDFWDHERLADQILAALRLRALSQQLVEEGMREIRALSWERSAKIVMDTYRRFL